MHHKLQSSSSKNDGKNSVVRKQQAKTNRQKSRDLEAEAPSGRHEGEDSKRSSRLSKSDAVRRKQNFQPSQSAVAGRKQTWRGKQPHAVEQPDTISEPTAIRRDRWVLHDATTLRCEVPHSAGFDPTGEPALPCGARAEVISETYGPMCAAVD